MENKDYSLVARVGIYEYPEINDTTKHYTLDMEAFGVRRGNELTADQIYERGSGSIVGMLKTMKRPSPMTLLWHPPEGQKLLFADLRRRKLRITISFVRSGNGTDHPDVISLLTMDNVRIMSILPEVKNGKGQQGQVRKN